MYRSSETITDLKILQMAAKVLSKAVEKKRKMSCFDMHYSDLSREKLKEFIPDEIYNFFIMCTDSAVLDDLNFDNSCLSLKALSLSHQLIAAMKTKTTPFLFGLSQSLYHMHGSRKTIDLLNAYGICSSYDNLRTFLTSAANSILDVHDDIIIPAEIMPIFLDDSKTIIDAAIDNFDHDEATNDGKLTTHKMAMVLYQRTEVVEKTYYIKSSEKAISEDKLHILDKIDFAPKQQVRPEPVNFPALEILERPECDLSFKKDFIWLMLNQLNEKSITWTHFNEKIFQKDIPVTNITYLPFINGQPSDINVIFTSLTRLSEIAMAVGQGHMLVTADMVIYSKAVEILWANPELSKHITMRLGTMHFIMALMASVGNIFGDGGLQALMVNSGILAEGSARQVLAGKNLNRGIRSFKLILQSLFQIYFEQAETWAINNNLPWLTDEVKLEFNEFSDKNIGNIEDILATLERSQILDTLSKFRSTGRDKSSTFKFWDDLIQLISIILKIVRADREADFVTHLTGLTEALPYFIIADRTMYAKYTPVYIAQMQGLEKTQPMMYHHLLEGGFVVRHGSTRKCNSVPTDQALEQSINKDAKSSSGVIGFTKTQSALTRWLLTRQITGKYSSMITETVKSERRFLESEAIADTKEILKLKEVLLNDFDNPFNINIAPLNLINISTGQEACSETQVCFSKIVETGKYCISN